MIKILKAKKEEVDVFETPEWIKLNMDYYGKDIRWNEGEFRFKAVENNEVLGTNSGIYESGVVFIRTLIVSEKKRNKGVGKALMSEVEKWAKKIKAHKICLNIGINWPSRKFYEKIGYKIEAKLPNHYFNKDFVMYSKFI